MKDAELEKVGDASNQSRNGKAASTHLEELGRRLESVTMLATAAELVRVSRDAHVAQT